MDSRRCFDILELKRDATMDEAKQAYKDLVNIWHPDRFSNNPRLRQKAEERLKEVNEAYEAVKSFLSSKKPLEAEKAPQPKAEAQGEAGTSAKARAEADYHKAQAKDKTEAFVEAGTGIVLSLLSYLSSAFRRIVAEVKTEVNQGALKQRQRGDDIRGKGGGRGMGRGKRMGRGRGKGRGGGRGVS